MMAVRIIEKSMTVYLAPASLQEVWKTFLATTKGDYSDLLPWELCKKYDLK